MYAFVVAVLAVILSTSAMAQDNPFAVRAEVGTLGVGGAVTYNVTPKVGLVFGYNGADISVKDSFDVDGVNYGLDIDSSNVYLNAELRPFENWFYTALGVASLDHNFKVTGTPTANSTYEIRGQVYNAQDVGSIRGEVSYNGLAPYIGLGFSPTVQNRWGVFGELGAYYTGKPSISLRADNPTIASAGGVSLQDTLDAEERKFQDKFKYQWYPMAKLGVTVRF